MLEKPKVTLFEAKDPAIAIPLMHECKVHYFGQCPASLAEEAVDAMMSGRSGCTLHIARDGIRAIGFVTLSLLHPGLSSSGTLFMKDLYVAEAHRGKGYGRLIMQAVARKAVALGCQRLDWTAETDNPRALEFYDALPAPRETKKIYYRLTGDDLANLARR